MTEWVKCNGCDGEVGIPESWTQATADCPKCGSQVSAKVVEIVLWRPASGNTSSKDTDSAIPPFAKTVTVPGWFIPAGMVAITSAIAGFAASALVAGGGSPEGALIAGCLNPLFFVGFPLGSYWLYRAWVCGTGDFLICPNCNAGIYWNGAVGSTVGCWSCKKKLRKGRPA